MINPKTYKITAEFYITTNQFESEEKLKEFVIDLITSLEGTDYKTDIVHNMVQVEFKH